MKIECQQKVLNAALNAVRRTVPARSTVPATQFVIMEARDGRLRLTTTDMSSTTSAWINVNGEQCEEGIVSLPARLVADLVAAMEEQDISIESGGDDPKVTLKAGRTKSAIIGADPREFPPIHEIDPLVSVEIEARTFRQAVSRVAIAAAIEEGRAVLNGSSWPPPTGSDWPSRRTPS